MNGTITSTPGILYGRIEKINRPYSYADLANKPTINGVPLAEGLFGRDLNLATTYFHDTEWWNTHPTISELNALYVYTDYETRIDDDGNEYFVAGFKIGDGNAYVADLPFQTTKVNAVLEKLDTHIADTTSHVSEEDRIRWDNKVSADTSGETLVLTKD